MKVLELFGGIGACSRALERLGIDYEIADYVEIDKYAVASFNAMHGTNYEPQDVCEWDKDMEVDLIMHGSPCQDFSLSGKQAGGDEGSGTRSSLMYETIRIVEKLKPKYVIWENVKNIVSKKHKHNYYRYCNKMNLLGYRNYGQILNSKDYGIPQNRERVFTISIRKDLNQQFTFPPKQELKLKLKDMLEDHVDEKYYLSDKMVQYISATGTANFKNPDSRINLDIARPITTDQNKRAGTTNYLSSELPNNCDLNGLAYIRNYGSKGKLQESECCDTLQAGMGTGGGNIPIVEECIEPLNPMPDGTCRTIKNQYYKTSKANFERKSTFGATGVIKIKNATAKGYLEATEGDGIDISSRMKYHRGNVQKQSIQTIDCTGGEGHGVVTKDLRIRKLTPLETWRLMGFDDSDFMKAEKVNSNTQLYKQAGNSIVVNVLEEILKNLLGEKNE